MAHMAEIRGTKTFKRLDYGVQLNLEKYGQETPPLIDLSRMEDKVPIALFLGKQDLWATPEGAEDIRSHLNESDYFYGEYDGVDHSSFHFGKKLAFLHDAIHVLKEKNPLPLALESDIFESQYISDLQKIAIENDF